MPATAYFIESYCHISSSGLNHNGTLNPSKETNFDEYLKSLYRTLDLKYPKFFKMDTLSKLSFLGADILLEHSAEEKTETALVFSNRSSSLDTDRKHQASITAGADVYPSPAVFVYTLPNIGMGEIAIRHQLHSENAFFVFDSFQAEFLQKYTLSLLHQKKATRALCAWVEVDGHTRHGFFYMVSKEGTIPHTKTEIEQLFSAENV
ncbi:MAG: 3-oxoacyl-ACP synthase [Marinirhabdus sp.]|nr:3-oxoacyl-ACP synthase [Marinirhabdus sp.]